MQLFPSPAYPALQAQLKPPVEFVHVAWASQPAEPFWHSSTSSHPTTDPPGLVVPEGQGLQFWPSAYSFAAQFVEVQAVAVPPGENVPAAQATHDEPFQYSFWAQATHNVVPSPL